MQLQLPRLSLSVVSAMLAYSVPERVFGLPGDAEDFSKWMEWGDWITPFTDSPVVSFMAAIAFYLLTFALAMAIAHGVYWLWPKVFPPKPRLVERENAPRFELEPMNKILVDPARPTKSYSYTKTNS